MSVYRISSTDGRVFSATGDRHEVLHAANMGDDKIVAVYSGEKVVFAINYYGFLAIEVIEVMEPTESSASTVHVR